MWLQFETTLIKNICTTRFEKITPYDLKKISGDYTSHHFFKRKIELFTKNIKKSKQNSILYTERFKKCENFKRFNSTEIGSIFKDSTRKIH